MLQLPRSSCFPVKMMGLVLPSAARPREKEREGTGISGLGALEIRQLRGGGQSSADHSRGWTRAGDTLPLETFNTRRSFPIAFPPLIKT